MTVRNRWFWLGCIALVLVGIAWPDRASAGCTASLNCNNGCSLSFLCLPPHSQWMLACSAPSQVRQCSGNTSCLVGSNYVECDGNRFYCSAAPQCTRTLGTTATCAGTTYSCQTCSPGKPGCFFAP